MVDLGELRASLAASPGLLWQLFAGMPRRLADANEGPGTWSPREVVAHLADLEGDAWIGRVEFVLTHGPSAPLPAVERDRFRRTMTGTNVAELLAVFAQRRQESLVALDELRLDAAALTREGRHSAFGSVTLAQLLATWYTHDLTHVSQIVRVVARQYGADVGPWSAFLSVLRARGSDGG